MRALALIAAVVAAGPARPAPARPALGGGIERRREAVAKELVRLGGELRRHIVAQDADALLARVPPDGLRCGDRTIPRAKVVRDLRTSGHWLHDVFFGGPAFAAGANAPRSIAEFLRGAKDVAVVVFFEPDSRAGPAGRPCLDFRAKGVVTPGAPLCFEQRDGRWWFTESLYPCG